jgi:hypothetical protein
MTPAAPTATWRKVCEEYFSRLIEDLEQQVESEVEARVSAAIDATLRGAVADAVGESRRALAEELNQSVRRVRKASSADDLYSVLMDVTIPFCDQAAIFSIHANVARAERMRRPAEVPAGENTEAASLPALEFPVSDAAAFSTAIDTRDPVVAMSTPAEVSESLVRLFGHKPDERVYLFPLVTNETVSGIFYAVGTVQAPPLELLSEVTGLQLHAFEIESIQRQAAASAAEAEALAAQQKSADSLVTLSGTLGKPAEAANSSVPETPELKPDAPTPHKEWWNLSRGEQQLHLAAQRFARVQVAEMRLSKSEAVRSGRAERDIYGALKPPIDEAREKFKEKHMTVSPTMVDYLHLELVRSLANDDPILLGPNYPGPLV